MTPESFGVPANQSETQEMRITAEVSMLFKGYNENIAIKLPPEAEVARSFSSIFMESTESDTAVLNGNVTAVDDVQSNETATENRT